MTRVLIAARLSRDADAGEASRIERDDEDCRAWAEREGRDVVATSEDRNVSGSVSPFDRPHLGPWLTESVLLARYDEIVASSLDRLGRSARDISDLRKWAEDHGKRITVRSPVAMSWPPQPGDIMAEALWSLIAVFAQLELDMIKSRHAAARATVRANGGFVGRPPFGFEVTGEKYHRTLAVDDRLEGHLREMVKRALAGDTITSIARYLDAAGVIPVQQRPEVDGGREVVLGAPLVNAWSPTSVAQVLRSPALKGRYLDAQGRAVCKFDGILSSSEWATLQTALDSRPTKRGPTRNESPMLLGSITCALCGGRMFRINSTTKRKDGSPRVCTYYRCKGKDSAPSTCRNSVPLADVEAYVNTWFTETGAFASTEIVEQVIVPGDDHEAEAAEVLAEIRELDVDDPEFLTRQADLLVERNRLLALPAEPASVIEQPTGQTVGGVWAGLDDAGRRQYLTAAGIRVMVRPLGPNEAGGLGRHTAWIEGDPHSVIGALRTIEAGQ